MDVYWDPQARRDHGVNSHYTGSIDLRGVRNRAHLHSSDSAGGEESSRTAAGLLLYR